MSIRRFSSILVATVTAFSLSLVTAGNAQAAPRQAAATVAQPVTGSFTDAAGGAGVFNGRFAVTRFVDQNGSVSAVGTLTGTLTDSAGTVLGSPSQEAAFPVQIAQTSCQIL